MTTRWLLCLINQGRTLGRGVLALGGELERLRLAANRRSWGARDMYTVILAPQRVAGVLRRRGGLVDVVRRPSRNDNSSNAGAV